MRTILIGVGVLVVLILAAIFIGPQLIPASVYRTQIANHVEDATGRPFKINGKISLSVFPTIKAHIGDASLGNAPGGKAANMAEIGRLDAGLALFPLLSGHVQVTNFVLRDAVIHLEVEKDGTPNWQFAKGAKTATPSESAPTTGGPSQLSLGDVRLVNGLITYDDLKSGKSYEVKDINARVQLPSLDHPLKINGSATYKDQTIDLTAAVNKPRAAFEGGTTPINASLQSPLLKASVNGDTTFGKEIAFSGTTSLDVTSLRQLAAWLGNPLSSKSGFGPLSISGQASYKAGAFAFDNAKLNIDQTSATGSVQGDLSGKIPSIKATLKTSKLDLRPYVSSTESSGSSEGSASASAGWSTAPIDVSPLRAFNATLDFDAGQILVSHLKIGKSVVQLKVLGGVLTANLKQLALYKGKGKGTITVDGTKSRPAVAAKLALSGLDLASFLKDAVNSSRFEGTGAFGIDVHGQGRSQKAIVSSLAGSSSIKFTNGAIKGVNLTAITNVVNKLAGKKGQQEATTAGQSAGDETKFVSLGGDFQIAKGIMTTNNFKMINDLVSLSGTGSINLPKETMDFRVTPGKSSKDGGLKVALRVRGPLAHPKIIPDPSALIQSEISKQLGKTKLGESPAGQLLQGILGGGGK
jgi:AsmA protein